MLKLKVSLLCVIAFAVISHTYCDSVKSEDNELADIEDPRCGHTVAITWKDQVYSGTVHTAFHIVTAAHPFIGVNVSELTVRAGSSNYMSGGQSIEVVGVFVHPKIYTESYTYDIAILKIKEPLHFFDLPIKNILYYNRPAPRPLVGTRALATGWGNSQKDGRIRLATVKLINNSVCQALYNYSGNTLCAGYESNQTATQVDSIGGPLMCQDNVTMCGVKVDAARNLTGYPGIYVNINNPEVYNWLYHYAP